MLMTFIDMFIWFAQFFFSKHIVSCNWE